MMRISRISNLVIFLVSLAAMAFLPRPDFKTTSTTKLTFKGTLGTMMKMFGGNKPITSTHYIQGDKSRTDNLDEDGKVTTSSIIDVDREVMINIDHKKKEYTEMTFAEFRDMLQSAAAKAKEESAGEKSESQVKVAFDVKVDKTGEKKSVADYNTEKVILTLTAQGEKQAEGGKPGEMDKGGMIVTSTNWMASEVKGYEEVTAFYKGFAEKLGMTPSSGGWAKVMESIMKSDPQLAEAMKKLEQEGKKLQGVPLMTESVFETWAQPSGAQAEIQQEKTEEQEKPKSVGGLLGGFGKKFGQKAAKKEDNAGSSGRNVLMESMTEITAISNAPFDGGLFAIPAGYTKKEVKK